MFARWFDDIMGGKNVIVVVVSTEATAARHWVVTAFLSRSAPKGDLEWEKA
jgi:hypothetical protein